MGEVRVIRAEDLLSGLKLQFAPGSTDSFLRPRPGSGAAKKEPGKLLKALVCMSALRTTARVGQLMDAVVDVR